MADPKLWGLVGVNSIQRTIDGLDRVVGRFEKALTTSIKLLAAKSGPAGGSSGISASQAVGSLGGATGGGRSAPHPSAHFASAAGGVGAMASRYPQLGFMQQGASPGRQSLLNTVPNGGARPSSQPVNFGAVSGAVPLNNVTAKGFAAPAPSLLQQVGNGGHPPANNSGGGGSSGGGGWGTSAALLTGYAGYSAIKGISSAVKRYGDQQNANQTMMELAAVQASLGMSGPSSAGQAVFLNQAYGTSATTPSNVTAVSKTDALAAELARIRISGGVDLSKGNARDVAVDRSYRALAMLNPTMSGEEAAVAAGQLSGPKMQRWATSFLGTTLYDKNHAFIGNSAMAGGFLKAIYGTDRVDEGTLQAGLGQGGSVEQTLARTPLDAKSSGAFAGYLQQYTHLTNNGIAPSNIDMLLRDASDKSSKNYTTARTVLKNADWQETNLQLTKDQLGLDRAGDRQVYDDYITNLKAANKQIQEGKEYWNEFKKLDLINWFRSLGGALSKFSDDPVGYLTGTAVSSYDKNTNAKPSDGLSTYSQRYGRNPDIPRTGLGGGNATHVPPGASGLVASPLAVPKPKSDGKGGDVVGKGSDKRSQPSAAGGVGAAISYAMAQLGKPYVWGATGPNSFDCSGLTMMAYKKAGIDIGRDTYHQDDHGVPVTGGSENWLPGDLVFSHGSGHVVMWLGGNKYINAPHTGDVVRIGTGAPGGVNAVRRIVGGGSSWKNASGVGASTSKSDTTKANGSPDPSSASSETNSDWAGSMMLGASMAEANEAGSVTELQALSGIFEAGSTVADAFRNGVMLSTGNSPTGTSSAIAEPDSGADTSGKNGSKDKAPKITGKSSIANNKRLGQQMAAGRGWSGNQWNSLYKLWMRESGWNERAKNRSSGAYGIPQSLPADKMASAGDDYLTNPATQIKWGLGYIANRYDTPAGAWAHSQSTGWYRSGAWNVKQDELATVHQGEMIVPAKIAAPIRAAIAGGGGSSDATSGSSTVLNFGASSIVIHMPGGTSTAAARSAARELAAELSRMDLQDKIAKGL